VTFPQGLVWQHLRQQALDTVPDGAVAAPGAPLGLAMWLRRGGYSVASTSSNSIVLETSGVDTGAALFVEAGLFLDHAQEHSIQVRHQLDSGRWFSPAWMSVSFYYWAFFLALALTRMMGKTPWFLAKDEADLLNGLSPSAGRVGPGVRIVICDGYVSGTMRSIALRRKSSQTRVHDAVWKLWFEKLRVVIGPLLKARSTDPELAIYLPQLSVADALGDSWPAEYRNAINYIPGLAYGAARHHTPTARFKSVRTASPLSVAEVIDRLTSDASAIRRAHLKGQLPECTKMLVDLTFVLDLLAHHLFAEIVERRSIDRRWVAGRADLARRNYAVFGDRVWPVAPTAAWLS
jgi:hypothetical protein